MSKKILGRGLSALLREEVVPIQKKSTEMLPIDLIEVNSEQPRKKFRDEKLLELSESINKHGVLQPLIVRVIEDGKFRIVAGERRYRAAKLANFTEIPVIVKNYTPKEELEIALIENIQREELNIIEEAEGYKKLVDEFGYSQTDLAESLGKSRSHVANLLRITQLPAAIKYLVINGKLSMGHARCLVGIEETHALELANQVVEKGLNVRQLEKLASEEKSGRAKKAKQQDSGAKEDNQEIIELAKLLSDKLNLKVTIENSGNAGRITLYYNTLEELDQILTKLD